MLKHAFWIECFVSRIIIDCDDIFDMQYANVDLDYPESIQYDVNFDFVNEITWDFVSDHEITTAKCNNEIVYFLLSKWDLREETTINCGIFSTENGYFLYTKVFQKLETETN